jgi:hypothetical protein
MAIPHGHTAWSYCMVILHAGRRTSQRLDLFKPWSPNNNTGCVLCVQARVVRWSREEYVWGGYAYCPEGAASARQALASPEWGGRLLFAGEATATHSNPQTVHGAIESGVRAAHEAMKALTSSRL